MKPQMHLAIDVSWTQVETTWREPGARVGRHYPDVGLFEDIARVAERGLIDLIFFGDSTGIPNTWKGSIDDAVRYGVAWPRLDMSPWIVAMSRVTNHVGFGLTYATTFMHPFYVARLLNSLDHITNGRIAFNVITSQRKADAQNYGFDELMEHGQRYDRMDEFMDVCQALWASVEPDAFEWNRETGLVANPAKVRAINHVGRFFKVKGPLSVPPSPQVVPVLIQAGGSPRGTRAAARFVDHVFGARKPIPAMAKQRARGGRGAARRRPRSLEGRHHLVDAGHGRRDRGRGEEDAGAADRPACRARRSASGCRTTPASTCRPCRRASRCASCNERIVAANASPVGFVGSSRRHSASDGEITLEEFFEHGLQDRDQLRHHRGRHRGADRRLSGGEVRGSGSRGGFMLRHSQAEQIELLHNIVDLLVPELQRRGRFGRPIRAARCAKTLPLEIGCPTSGEELRKSSADGRAETGFEKK